MSIFYSLILTYFRGCKNEYFLSLQELEIEKGKYQELMRKYQAGSQETEEKVISLLL